MQAFVREAIDIQISDITLLSVDEAKAVPNKLRDIGEFWWLREPGDYFQYAAYVNSDGSVCGYGNLVDYRKYAVRPALKIRGIESANLHLDDVIEVAGYGWTIIPGGYALCNKTVGFKAFRKDANAPDANNFEKSDIKRWLHTWAVKKDIVIN